MNESWWWNHSYKTLIFLGDSFNVNVTTWLEVPFKASTLLQAFEQVLYLENFLPNNVGSLENY